MDELTDYLDNAESAEVLGWDPTWLGLPPNLDINHHIVSDAVAMLQATHAQPVTGVLDAVTWMRLEFMRSLDVTARPVVTPAPSDCVFVGGERVRVPFPVVTWDEPGGHQIKRTFQRKGRTRTRFGSRNGAKTDRVVLHWTGTKTPAGTWRKAWNTKRGVSTHFEIGDDGTTYQLVDLANAAWQAGKRWINECSIGVDITLSPVRKDRERVNAVLEAHGLQRRPEVSGVKVRGWDPGPFLGATDQQIAQLRRMAPWFRDRFGIPMTSPDDPDHPLVVPAVCDIGDATPEKLPPGWLHHAHFKRGRWDTACVSLPQLFQGL